MRAGVLGLAFGGSASYPFDLGCSKGQTGGWDVKEGNGGGG